MAAVIATYSFMLKTDIDVDIALFKGSLSFNRDKNQQKHL